MSNGEEIRIRSVMRNDMDEGPPLDYLAEQYVYLISIGEEEESFTSLESLLSRITFHLTGEYLPVKLERDE